MWELTLYANSSLFSQISGWICQRKETDDNDRGQNARKMYQQTGKNIDQKVKKFNDSMKFFQSLQQLPVFLQAISTLPPDQLWYVVTQWWKVQPTPPTLTLIYPNWKVNLPLYSNQFSKQNLEHILQSHKMDNSKHTTLPLKPTSSCLHH